MEQLLCLRNMSTIDGSSSMTKRDEPPLRGGFLLTLSAAAAIFGPVLSHLPV